MKRILSLICLFLAVSASVLAESPTAVLDRAAAKFKSMGSLKVVYTFTVQDQTGKGAIRMKGRKFVNDLGEQVIWFDGKTMWTLVRDNEEVNVTQPTPKEVSRMNPYAFVSLYKNGYNVSEGASTNAYHEFVLKAKDSETSLQTVVLRLNRSSLQPIYVKMAGADAQAVEIQVTSFAKIRNYPDALFVFPDRKFPNVDIIDLR